MEAEDTQVVAATEEAEATAVVVAAEATQALAMPEVEAREDTPAEGMEAQDMRRAVKEEATQRPATEQRATEQGATRQAPVEVILAAATLKPVGAKEATPAEGMEAQDRRRAVHTMEGAAAGVGVTQ
jgi:hypothetical protein